METKIEKLDIAELKALLQQKNLKISDRRLRADMERINEAHKIFPMTTQQALIVRLIHTYETTKKKEVIHLREWDRPDSKGNFILGVLAEDWPGMSNSILGIIHHKKRNVRFMKGFTLEWEGKTLGIVIMTFKLKSLEEYEPFIINQKTLIMEIKDAARGSTSKYLLLDDEAIKFDIYNKILKKTRELYHNSELVKIIDESGEVLKFVSSRSREYLEERKIKDLASLILNNYIYQNMIKSGAHKEIVKIKNFKTKTESLTGITFVCKEHIFSIEDFLKTLNHIVPDHLIKHHKSYVTRDGILVYRIEIVDLNGNALEARLIKSIEASLSKLISIACSKKFSKMKSVGGFEHYARAIIPFLQEELKRTQLTQVFIDVDGKNEFRINIRLVIVNYHSGKKRIYTLISKLSIIPGLEIYSAIPPKIHNNKIEINILKLKVNLSEFSNIKEIYSSIKNTVKKIYGDIRDFDEGFRDIYIRILNQLLESLKNVDATLVREIFFNIDELYKIEISPTLLLELMRTCADVVEESKILNGEKILLKHKQLPESHRTVLVISYTRQRRLMSRLMQKLTNVRLYFTKIEWNQRYYLLMILSKDNEALENKIVDTLKDVVRGCGKNGMKEC